METGAGGPSQAEAPFSAVKAAEPIPPFANGDIQAARHNAMLRLGMARREEMHCRYTVQCSSHKRGQRPPCRRPSAFHLEAAHISLTQSFFLSRFCISKMPPTNKNMRVEHHAQKQRHAIPRPNSRSC